MTLATQYARALYASTAPDAERLSGLRAALKRRGHEKLLPQIFAGYTRLALQEKRLTNYKKTTPEKEQTRVLLELYKKLTEAHG